MKEVRILQGSRAVRPFQSGHVSVIHLVIWGQMNNNAVELRSITEIAFSSWVLCPL